MSDDEHTTTNDHFVAFKDECERWIDKLGLYGWKFTYFHEDWGNAKATNAVDFAGRLASINLSTTWRNVEPTYFEVRCSAFHEVCEVMLHSFRRGEDTTEEVHDVIRRLERAMFKPDFDKRHKNR